MTGGKKSLRDNFIKQPLFWLSLFLIFIIGFLLISVDRTKIVVSQSAVYGEGSPHYVAKWVPTPPPGNFTLSGSSSVCNSVSLSWTDSLNADGYRIYRNGADITPYPYTATQYTDTAVSQNTLYNYYIIATNQGGSVNSNTVSITTPYCPPTVFLSSDISSAYLGQPVALTWSSIYATACVASGNWSGSKPTGGTETVRARTMPVSTFTLTCSNPGYSDTKSVSVNVSPLGNPVWQEVAPRL